MSLAFLSLALRSEGEVQTPTRVPPVPPRSLSSESLEKSVNTSELSRPIELPPPLPAKTGQLLFICEGVGPFLQEVFPDHATHHLLRIRSGAAPPVCLQSILA